MRRVHILTFGCQMNKLDSDLARAALVRAGHDVVKSPDDADVLLFNTCAVRDHAERRVLARLAQIEARKRANPGLLVAVMGCLAERRGEALFSDAPVVDLVCGTRWFPRLPELLARAESAPVAAVGDPPDAPFHPEDELPSPDYAGRPAGARAFLAVMRGCDNPCAYCVVPSLRGPERSRPAGDVAAEAKALAARGAREITLLGQNIDAYGRELGLSLADLLEILHERVPADGGLPRLRFVTSHPRDITPRLARAVRDLPRVGKHFHMPAQSGSDPVLARMRRGYTRAQYDEKLAMLREECPGSAAASDFIVGFPGETDADFARTLDLVERAGFQNSFIFKYSPRPGTSAARDLPDDVPDAVKRERNHLLLAAQDKAARARTARLAGSATEVLVEGVSPRDARRLVGRTLAGDVVVFAPDGIVDDRAGARAAAPPEEALPPALVAAWTGRLARVTIRRATALTLHGEIVYTGISQNRLSNRPERRL